MTLRPKRILRRLFHDQTRYRHSSPARPQALRARNRGLRREVRTPPVCRVVVWSGELEISMRPLTYSFPSVSASCSPRRPIHASRLRKVNHSVPATIPSSSTLSSRRGSRYIRSPRDRSLCGRSAVQSRDCARQSDSDKYQQPGEDASRRCQSGGDSTVATVVTVMKTSTVHQRMTSALD